MVASNENRFPDIIKSIFIMLEGLKDLYNVSEEILHSGMILDRYYIGARYTDGFPEGTPSEYFDKKNGKGSA
ncbi:hypothetical protein SAMN05660826_02213 [Caldanaerovirga acetigignens]|uniref:Uncharacterized protein n=1 Tax=Caldanaerovirga acetigignens TaxID=447595 RepID=A0A1M7M9C0_9FIRM|nr:hypothetical protein [Caldanaerovirga acetigignens]SHM87384.1 hypothetical protein SAMN05660826_02213 [Caldanaerovirga acetigignens]